MVVAYVTLANAPTGHADVPPASCVHAMLLPTAEGSWHQLSIRPSSLGGSGCFANGTDVWSKVASLPVILPYFGAETVVHHARTQRLLVQVLLGNFVCVTVHEVEMKLGHAMVADGHFAVPAEGAQPL